MFDNEFPPFGGGTGVVNYHLFQEFSAYPDVFVNLVTSSRTKSDYEFEQFSERIAIYKVPVDNRNIHHATNPELLRYGWRGLRKARELLAGRHADMSFAFAGVPAGAMSYALKVTHGLPYLVSLQGPDVPGFETRYNYLYPALKPVLRRVWTHAAAVTSINLAQQDLARRTMPTLQTTVIPNAVDTRFFHPTVSLARRAEVTLLCVARLIERKGQHHLLRAFANLRTRSAGAVRLVLVGAGDAQESFQSLAKQLGLTDAVTFMGAVAREHMADVYQQADIFVLPSEHEGMSLALLEAMASGLPVVVTNTGGAVELVGAGANGHIVPWADASALEAVLSPLIREEDVRRRMGAESRRRAEQFGWPAYARQYLDLCERIIVESRPRHAVCARA